jgi:hypothetical protein
MDKVPVLVRGDFHQLTLAGAKPVMRAIAPYDAQHGVRYGWGIGPACDKPSEHPALTVFRLGKGTVHCLAPPIFSDYAQHANAQQIAWFRSMWLQAKVPFRAHIENPHGNVELVLWENATTTWAVLVQHRGEQLAGMHGMPTPWMRSLGPLPCQQFAFSLRRNGRTPRRVTMAGKTIPFTMTSVAIKAPVRLDQVWGVVRVEWK